MTYRPFIASEPSYDLAEHIARLLFEHTRALTDKGLAYKKTHIKSLDCIDVRNLLPEEMPDNPAGRGTAMLDANGIRDLWHESQVRRFELKFQNKPLAPFFEWIPCYEEGTIWVNQNRWFYFKIQELNLSDDGDNTCTLYVRDYTFGTTKWSPGVSATIQLKHVQGKTKPYQHYEMENVELEILDYQLYKDIYTTFSDKELMNDLHWSKHDMQVWKNNILAHSINVETQLTDDDGICQEIHGMLICFLTVINNVNFRLNQSKPSRGMKTAASRNQNKNKIKNTYDNATPEKLVRNIFDSDGQTGISFTSAKAPKSPNQEYLRNYKVSSWRTRGHMRTYKDGRQVYIKETTHRRKGMEDSTSPATHLRFKNVNNKKG